MAMKESHHDYYGDSGAVMDYDTQGRRIRVYDAAAGTETLYYYSDQWQVLAEYASSGTQQAHYVYGNYIDEVLLMHRAGADVFYLHDHLYSPVALLSSAGSVIERYEYDAYGKVTVWNSDFSSTYAYSQFDSPYTFTGRELDVLDMQTTGGRQSDYAIYEPGHKRISYTRRLTRSVLIDFRNWLITSGGCECQKFYLRGY